MHVNYYFDVASLEISMGEWVEINDACMLANWLRMMGPPVYHLVPSFQAVCRKSHVVRHVSSIRHPPIS